MNLKNEAFKLKLSPEQSKLGALTYNDLTLGQRNICAEHIKKELLAYRINRPHDMDDKEWAYMVRRKKYLVKKLKVLGSIRIDVQNAATASINIMPVGHGHFIVVCVFESPMELLAALSILSQKYEGAAQVIRYAVNYEEEKVQFGRRNAKGKKK